MKRRRCKRCLHWREQPTGDDHNNGWCQRLSTWVRRNETCPCWKKKDDKEARDV